MCSPLKYTPARLFFFLMQMVKWFLERGWLQKGLGLQTQRELMCHMLQEKRRARTVSQLSAQSAGRAHSAITTWQAFLFSLHCFSASHLFYQVELSLCVPSLFLVNRGTSSLSSGGWMNTGLKPSSGTKLDFALSSLQRWALSFFLPSSSSLLFGCGRRPFRCDLGWHLLFGTLLL